VQILLANEGRHQSNWQPVVEQLVRMKTQPHPLVAVIGLGISDANSTASTRELSRYGIPMVAATANALEAEGLFRITPSNAEYVAALRRSWPGPTPDFLLTIGEPDPYVQSLRESFLAKWKLPEIRGSERIYLLSCPSALLYAGHAVGDLILYLQKHCEHRSVTIGVVGRPTAGPLREDTIRVVYAMPVDLDGWQLNPAQAPEGFGTFRDDYCGRFHDSLADSFALLYHDAATAAFTALQHADEPRGATTVRAALRNITVYGATGTFTFDANGNPENKPVPVVTSPAASLDEETCPAR
jgi:ABC-type branched-subunit amino acid transport system substrate-binding protein